MKHICIVGCGSISKTHAKELSGRAALYFHSRSRDSAERANSWFRGLGVFTNYSDVLNDPKIDAVIICSPPERHKDQIVQALAAGKSVLVEKPMCVSEEEVNSIQAALKTSRATTLMVAENYYYKPSVRQIRSAIDEGLIGDIQSLQVKKVLKEATPGWKGQHGAMLEGGIHFIALISDIFQMNPSKVNAVFPGNTGEPERHCILDLTYPTGATARFTYSLNTYTLTKGILQHSYLKGTKGTITFETNGLYLIVNGVGRRRMIGPDFSDLMGFKAMMNDFLGCLEQPTQLPYSDFAKAKRDLGIIWQAYSSLRPEKAARP